MTKTFQHELRSSRESIAEGAAAVAAWLAAEQVPPDAALLAKLAIDELVSNVVKYGYDDDLEHIILVECRAGPEEFTVRVVDDGHPFDPVGAPAPPDSSPALARQPGGLGLHLLRQLADRFTYERRDGRNHMTLVKVLRR